MNEKAIEKRTRKEIAPYMRNTLGGKVFNVFNIVFMILFIFVMVYPFWNQLIISLNAGSDTVMGGLYFWPRVFTFENFEYVFRKSSIPRGFLISILRVSAGTLTSILCTGLLAYVTTVRFFSGRKFMRIVFIATMYFGGGMIPYYLVMTALHLTNTFTIYWLPQLFSAYNMLLISSYIYGLSESLMESARMDGAGELRIYFRIVMPICKPVIAAVAIMTAVGHWNSWFDVLIYNASGKWDTLQVYLRRILLEAEMAGQLLNDQRTEEAMRNLTTLSVRAATTMIVTIPIICVYPFFQKYFISGITIGAVKE